MKKPMTRWRAALIHFGASAVVAAAVLATFVLLWYPPAVFSAAGATRLAQLLIGVDVVLGPLLTLVVFNPGKASLRFDLSVIVLIQFAALVYGLHVAWTTRPIFIVATGERFEWVTANRVTPEQLAKAPTPELREYPLGRPKLIAAHVPADPAQQQEIIDAIMTGKGDVEGLPRYYVPYVDEAPAIAKKIRPLDTLPQWRDPTLRARIGEALAGHHLKPEDAGWQPYILKNRDIAMLLRVKDGMPIAPFDTPAWPE